MKLYMIRHGQTTCNVAGKHQGWGPVSLSEKGFEQARKAKEYVRTVNYDKIFVSDLLRTRQTAEILFPEKYRALFSDLFQYFIDSLIEQIAGVRALFRIFPAVLDHIIHILQHVIVHFYISLSSRL